MATSSLHKYSVRSVVEWPPKTANQQHHTYEERITLWTAEDPDSAIALAERECEEYCKFHGFTPLNLYQCFLVDESPEKHTEVFSLLRDSDLGNKAYVNSFFATGKEHQN